MIGSGGSWEGLGHLMGYGVPLAERGRTSVVAEWRIRGERGRQGVESLPP